MNPLEAKAKIILTHGDEEEVLEMARVTGITTTFGFTEIPVFDAWGEQRCNPFGWRKVPDGSSHVTVKGIDPDGHPVAIEGECQAEVRLCWRCHGQGDVSISLLGQRQLIKCETCKGTGVLP